jgi:hypothetical protein
MPDTPEQYIINIYIQHAHMQGPAPGTLETASRGVNIRARG